MGNIPTGTEYLSRLCQSSQVGPLFRQAQLQREEVILPEVLLWSGPPGRKAGKRKQYALPGCNMCNSNRQYE